MSKEQETVVAAEREKGSFEQYGKMTDSMDNLENDPALLAKVTERLASAHDVPAEEIEDGVVLSKEESTEDAKPKETTVVEKASVTPDSPSDSQETSENVPALPLNYKRAAIHAGWEEKDVQDFFEADPDRAMRTFQNIYTSVKNLSDRFSAIGRNSQASPTDNSQAQVPQGSKQSNQTTKRSIVDIEALREKHGEDALIDGVIVPLNDALNQIMEENRRLNSVAPSHPAAASHEAADKPDAAVVQIIDQFFNAADMQAEYGEFYGSSPDVNKRTLEQNRNRYDLIATADRILAGAYLQGIQMSEDQALNQAHLIVSDEVKAAAIRKEIRKTAVERTKGLSLRPSKSKAPAPTDGRPATEAELVKRTQAKLSSISW